MQQRPCTIIETNPVFIWQKQATGLKQHFLGTALHGICGALSDIVG